MIPAHQTHHTTQGAGALEGAGLPLALLAVLVLVLGYVVLAYGRSTEPRGWNPWRTTAFLTGAVLLGLGLIPQASPYPEHSLPSHMYQHLLIGMYAPIGLVLGAPVSLLLRSLPRRYGKTLGRVLRSRPLHFLAHPVTSLVLNIGGLAALYFTPLYAAAAQTPALHWVIHAHFLLAGCLFAWVIAGPDPAPRRPTVPARLVVLGVAIAGHAIISQLLYAGLFTQVNAPAAELRQAGELMNYAGDIAELILAFAMVSSWRPRPRRQTAPTTRQTAPGAAA
jgi:putative membrane protein